MRMEGGHEAHSADHQLCRVMEEEVLTGTEGTEMYPPPGHEEEDVELQLLTRRLQLLSTQRQLAAQHCQKFVRFLEQSTNWRSEPKEFAGQPGRASGEGGEEGTRQSVKSASLLVNSETVNAQHRRQASCPEPAAPLLKAGTKGSRDARPGALNQHRRQSSCPEEPLPTAHELLSFLEKGGDIVGAHVGLLTSAKNPRPGHLVASPSQKERLAQEELLKKLPKSTSMSKHRRHRRSCSLETFDSAVLTQHADVARASEQGVNRRITLGKDIPADPFADVALEWEVVGTKPTKGDGVEKGKGTWHRRQRSLAVAGEVPFGEGRSPVLVGKNPPGFRSASSPSPSTEESFLDASTQHTQLNRSPPNALKLNPCYGSINLSPSHSISELTWQGPDSSAPRQHPRRPGSSPRNSSLPPLSPAISWTTPPPQTTKSGNQLASNRAFLPPRPLVVESEVSPCSPPLPSSVSPSPNNTSRVQPQFSPSPSNSYLGQSSLSPPGPSYLATTLQRSHDGAAMTQHQLFNPEQMPSLQDRGRHAKGRPPPLVVDCEVSPGRVMEWYPQVHATVQVNSAHVSIPRRNIIAAEGGGSFVLRREQGDQRQHQHQHQSLTPPAMPPVAASQYALPLPRSATSPLVSSHPDTSDKALSGERQAVNQLQRGGFGNACTGPHSPSSESSEVLTSPSTPPVPRSTSTPVWGVPQKDKAAGRIQGGIPSSSGQLGGASPEAPPIPHSLSQPPATNSRGGHVSSTGYMDSIVARATGARSPSLAGPPSLAPGPMPSYNYNLYPGQSGSENHHAAAAASRGWQVNCGESSLGSFSSVGQESLESFPSGSSFLPSPRSREVTPPKGHGLGQVYKI